LSKPALWHMFNHMIDYLSLFSFQRSVISFTLQWSAIWRLDYNNMWAISCQHIL